MKQLFIAFAITAFITMFIMINVAGVNVPQWVRWACAGLTLSALIVLVIPRPGKVQTDFICYGPSGGRGLKITGGEMCPLCGIDGMFDNGDYWRCEECLNVIKK